jgi:hypothetical protein
VVLARYTRSGDARNDVHYIVELRGEHRGTNGGGRNLVPANRASLASTATNALARQGTRRAGKAAACACERCEDPSPAERL